MSLPVHLGGGIPRPVLACQRHASGAPPTAPRRHRASDATATAFLFRTAHRPLPVRLPAVCPPLPPRAMHALSFGHCPSSAPPSAPCPARSRVALYVGRAPTCARRVPRRRRALRPRRPGRPGRAARRARRRGLPPRRRRRGRRRPAALPRRPRPRARVPRRHRDPRGRRAPARGRARRRRRRGPRPAPRGGRPRVPALGLAFAASTAFDHDPRAEGRRASSSSRTPTRPSARASPPSTSSRPRRPPSSSRGTFPAPPARALTPEAALTRGGVVELLPRGPAAARPAEREVGSAARSREAVLDREWMYVGARLGRRGGAAASCAARAPPRARRTARGPRGRATRPRSARELAEAELGLRRPQARALVRREQAGPRTAGGARGAAPPPPSPAARRGGGRRAALGGEGLVLGAVGERAPRAAAARERHSDVGAFPAPSRGARRQSARGGAREGLGDPGAPARRERGAERGGGSGSGAGAAAVASGAGAAAAAAGGGGERAWGPRAERGGARAPGATLMARGAAWIKMRNAHPASPRPAAPLPRRCACS